MSIKPGTVAKIRIINEVHMMIVGLHGDHLMHFYNKYAILSANYFFNPKYKLGQWDGKIRYFQKDGKTYLFLLEQILPQLAKFGYKIEIEDVRDTEAYQPDNIDENIFAHILHPDSKRPIILRDYQIEAVNTLIDHGFGVCVAGTGAGKEQPLDSKILTPTGWIRMGDIQIGDVVITPSNQRSKVKGIFPQGQKQIYEISFSDGTTAKCGIDHLWKVYRPKHRGTSALVEDVVTTATIIEHLQNNYRGNISIPLTNPVEFDIQNILPIQPYVLGALLGDGCLRVDTQIISSADDFVLNKLRHHLANICEVIHVKNYDYKLTHPDWNTQFNSLNVIKTSLQQLRLLGVKSYDKFIPDEYKWASLEDRRELIRGLVDTDGTVSTTGQIQYYTTSRQMALDVQCICLSLGYYASLTSKKTKYKYQGQVKRGKDCFTVHISGFNISDIVSLPRKKEKCNDNYRGGNKIISKRIVNVSPIGVEEAQCIMLDDAEHLYITDNYNVTHNTFMCAALVMAHDKLNVKSITIVPDQTLIRQTKRDYINCGLDTGEYSGNEKSLNHKHVVSTWQALKNNPMIMNQFDMVIVDECHGLRGNVLQKIICDHAAKMPYRFGFTGTLPKDESEKMLVHIAVGPERYTIPAHELQERGVLSTIQIDILQLEEDLTEQYQQWCIEENFGKPPTYTEFKDSYFGDFSAEKSYVQRKTDRMEWIANFITQKADQKKGNVLCLVDSIPIGRQIAALIPNAIFVNGQDVKDVKKRQKVYDMFATHDNLIVIATVHIAGTGLSINRIFNLISVDIGKSFIRVIQAIGRGLRMDDDKDHVSYTDICSDLKYGKKHLTERIKFYKEARYPYKKNKIKYTKNVLEELC